MYIRLEVLMEVVRLGVLGVLTALTDLRLVLTGGKLVGRQQMAPTAA
jgi:hypothetical protein